MQSHRGSVWLASSLAERKKGSLNTEMKKVGVTGSPLNFGVAKGGLTANRKDAVLKVIAGGKRADFQSL